MHPESTSALPPKADVPGRHWKIPLFTDFVELVGCIDWRKIKPRHDLTSLEQTRFYINSLKDLIRITVYLEFIMPDSDKDLSKLLNELFKHGTAPFDPAIEIRLVDCPDHVSVIRLLELILEMGKAPQNPKTADETERLDKCLSAIIDLVGSLKEFDILICSQKISGKQLENILLKIQHWPHTILDFLGRQEVRPKLYLLLWKGALKSGVLCEQRDSCSGTSNNCNFAQRQDFIEYEPWLKNLTESPDNFAKAIKSAISICKEENPTQPHRNQKFYRLKKNPNPKILRKIIAHDKSDLSVPPSIIPWIKFVLVDRKLLEIPLPDDWEKRLYGDRSMIAAVAEGIIETARFNTGPRPDPALDQYFDRLVSIHKRLTGRKIKYSKTAQTSNVHGPDIDFLDFGLQLVDWTYSTGSIRGRIDKIRELEKHTISN